MAPQSPSIASAAKQTSTPSVNTKELRVIKDSQCRNDNYKERPSTLHIVMASGAKTSRRIEKASEFKVNSIQATRGSLRIRQVASHPSGFIDRANLRLAAADCGPSTVEAVLPFDAISAGKK